MATKPGSRRISKRAFVISIMVLLVFTVVAVASRFVIRLRLRRRHRQHKQQHQLQLQPQPQPPPRIFGIDDGFLVAGLACAVAGTMLLLHHVDHLYRAGAFGAGLGGGTVVMAPAAVAALLHYHRVFVASSVLLWLAMCCVKFSFLFFFRRLVWRQPGRVVAWWWAVLAFTAATTAYTLVIHVAACPHYGDLPKLAKCARGAALRRANIIFDVGTVTDIFSDVLILTFPVRIIWQIRVRWTQKLALAASLCLTVLMIAFTLVRVIGPTPKPDKAWATYWMIVPSLVGLVLTASTALRALFVAHPHTTPQQRRQLRANSDAVVTFGGGGGGERKRALSAYDVDVEASAADDSSVVPAEKKAWSGLTLQQSLWSSTSVTSTSSSMSSQSSHMPTTAAGMETADVRGGRRSVSGDRSAGSRRFSDLESEGTAYGDIKDASGMEDLSAQALHSIARDGGDSGVRAGGGGAPAAADAAAGGAIQRPQEAVLRGTLAGQRPNMLVVYYSRRRGSI